MNKLLTTVGLLGALILMNSESEALRFNNRTNVKTKRDYTVFVCPAVDEMKHWVYRETSIPDAGWFAYAASGIEKKDWEGRFITTDKSRPEFTEHQATSMRFFPSSKFSWRINCFYEGKNFRLTNDSFQLTITPDDGFKECTPLGPKSVACDRN